MVTGNGHRLNGEPPSRLSLAAWLYMAVVVAGTALVLVQALSSDAETDSAGTKSGVTLVVLALLFLVCDSTPTTLTSRQSAWSPSSSATLAAVVLLGPLGALAVGAASLLSVRRGAGFVQRVFSASVYGLSGYCAGRAYLALGGPVGLPRHAAFPAIIVPFAVAAVVHVFLNHGLLLGMLMLVPPVEAGQPGQAAGRHIPLLFFSDLGYATLGLLIAALWGGGPGAFAAILILVNVVVHAQLSTPSPFRIFVTDPPVTFIAYWPYILLPGFLVPLAWLGHAASLIQLRRRQA